MAYLSSIHCNHYNFLTSKSLALQRPCVALSFASGFSVSFDFLSAANPLAFLGATPCALGFLTFEFNSWRRGDIYPVLSVLDEGWSNKKNQNPFEYHLSFESGESDEQFQEVPRLQRRPNFLRGRPVILDLWECAIPKCSTLFRSKFASGHLVGQKMNRVTQIQKNCGMHQEQTRDHSTTPLGGSIKQCKSMVISRDFPLVHCLGC